MCVFCIMSAESSQNFTQDEADEPSTSSAGVYVNQGVVEPSTSNETPLKQKPAKPHSSPLDDNVHTSPGPNCIDDDDSDWKHLPCLYQVHKTYGAGKMTAK